MTALVLAGHGSSVSEETGGIVRRAAELLKQWRVADEVACTFWKEPPYFSEAADSLQSNKMIVVPVFAARGWYVDVVLPRELAKGRKDVEYVITPSIGEHPRMTELVVDAAKRALSVSDGSLVEKTPVTDAQGSLRTKKAIVIIGHGTSKHIGSRNTTFAIIERLKSLQIADRVEPAFLDDEPSIAHAVAACKGFRLVAVANFIAKGSHVENDVPTAVREALDEEDFTYATPNLTAEEIAKMAMDLAGEVEFAPV